MHRSLVLTCMLAACATTPLPDATAFTVLSWNIRYGSARDGVNAWPHRCDELARQITAAAPQILGVQEALDFQLTFLQQHLPEHQRIGQGRDGGDRGEHAALFIDRRRFAVIGHGDFWLSPTPAVPGSIGWDAALTRICTWAELEDLADGSRLFVANAHFDHRGEEARARSGDLLVERLAPEGGACVLLGDFNCGERSPALLALKTGGLRDTFRDRQPAATAVGTFHAFTGRMTGDKIDHVLAGSALATVDAGLLTAAGANGRWPSDHHGVLAVLRRDDARRH
ncbi:MAG: endonuclease/exonuclease/phosphatase family protein [Planctomycetes bacterium]|nr:endonuclease/exonuclease/phosphatase family protein [Planctomycetota bacterium]